MHRCVQDIDTGLTDRDPVAAALGWLVPVAWPALELGVLLVEAAGYRALARLGLGRARA